MRIHTAAAALAFCALAVTAQSASAQSYTYTSLEPNACKGAPGNAAAQRNDHGVVSFNCPGAAGWRVRLVFQGVATKADFLPPGSKTSALILSAPYDIGPRIEWISTRPGAAPHAAIVRLHARTAKDKTASALALLRISGSKMCLYAFAAPDENAGLRAIANEAKCGSRPVIHGTGAEVIQEFMERNR